MYFRVARGREYCVGITIILSGKYHANTCTIYIISIMPIVGAAFILRI